MLQIGSTQSLNFIQRFAEILLQRFVIADIQNIFTVLIVSIIAFEHQIALCRIIKHHGFPAVAVKITRGNSGITLSVVAVQLTHPAVSVTRVGTWIFDTAAVKVARISLKHI